VNAFRCPRVRGEHTPLLSKGKLETGSESKRRSRVIFLRAVEPPDHVLAAQGAPVAAYQQEADRRTKEAEPYLATLEGKFREKGIKIRRFVAFGPVVQTILQIAQEKGGDLIAMGSHGRSGLSRVFYGSVAAGVLHCVDRPLLLIRSQND